jgi:uncharacterized protein YegP (UPF0339 family)
MKRAPKLVFYVDAAGEHRWRVVAGNGRKVADSGEGYSSRGKAEKGAAVAGLALAPKAPA